MLKAGFVKELIYFTRTKKLPVLSIIILAFAVLDPLLIFGLGKKYGYLGTGSLGSGLRRFSKKAISFSMGKLF